MNSQPWWLPDNWTDIGLSIVGVACAVQIWKLHCRHKYGRKPPRYVVAAVSAVATGLFLTALCLLDDQPLKQSIRLGLMWGSSAPVLWLGIQMASLKWFPWLSPAVGADRRESPRDGEVWTEERRKGWLEDTVEIKRKPNGQGGFMTMWLIMGIAGAALMAAVAVQSWRLSQAHEALGAERVAKTLALARIEALSAEKRAAEASLSERDAAHEAIRRFSVQTDKRLREVAKHDPDASDWLDRVVPDGIKRLLADRRGGGHPKPQTSHDTPATDSGSGGGGGDAQRSGAARPGTSG